MANSGSSWNVITLLASMISRQFLVVWKGEKWCSNSERIRLFYECANFEQALRNPKYWVFNFRFQCGFRDAWKLLKKRKSVPIEIKANFVHCMCCFPCVEILRQSIFHENFSGRVLHRPTLKCWLTSFVNMGSKCETEFEYLVVLRVQVQLAGPIVACCVVFAVFFEFRILIWVAYRVCAYVVIKFLKPKLKSH